jgi:NAD(P)H dehydrogenase (quinone)
VHALAVLSHPSRGSFSAAMLDAFVAGAHSGGHSVDVLDLHNEPFAMAFQAADLAQFSGAPMPSDVLTMQARIAAADALCFVYPVYWWTMPALMRGWVDRVFSAGWAYRVTDEAHKGLLKNRPTIVLQMAGAREETVEQFGYGPAMRRLIDDGLFRYCGLSNMHVHTVFDVHDSAPLRDAGLATARRLGAGLSTLRPVVAA